MARHYYRTNVPLPVMIVWWVFLGICVLIYGAYDTLFQAPERHAREQAQAQWDRDHFNGWRLEKVTYDSEHGLFTDKLDHVTCTTVGYPGYPPCPAQQYFVDGKPQAYQATPAEEKKPTKRAANK